MVGIHACFPVGEHPVLVVSGNDFLGCRYPVYFKNLVEPLVGNASVEAGDYDGREQYDFVFFEHVLEDVSRASRVRAGPQERVFVENENGSRGVDGISESVLHPNRIVNDKNSVFKIGYSTCE